MTIERARDIAEEKYQKYKAYSLMPYKQSYVFAFNFIDNPDDYSYFYVKVDKDGSCNLFDPIVELAQVINEDNEEGAKDIIKAFNNEIKL